MPIYLRQSTSGQEVTLGYFVDSTDGNTAETGLGIANTDVKLHKAGATTLAAKSAGGGTHIADGIYYVHLDASDTDTAGSLVLYCHVSGALAVRCECVVLPAQVYDSLIAGTDLLDANTAQWLGTACATPTVAGVPEVDITHVAGATTNVAALATNVDAILTDTAVIGAAGAGLTAVASASDLATVAAYLDTEIAAILADTNELQTDWANGGRLDLILDAASAPSAAAVADAVWDEAISGHLTAGSAGEALNAAGAAGDPWVTSLPGAYGAGSAGKIIGDNINATISSRASQTSLDTVDDLLDTEVAAIKADTAAILTDTAEIGVAGAGLTAINLPDQTMNITGNLSGSVGSVTGSVGSLATQAKADVNAELVDALSVDTYAEPGQGAPAATATLAAKIGYLFKLARNKKTQTATTFSLYDDAGTTVDQKSAVSDDGTTATRGEITTGP